MRRGPRQPTAEEIRLWRRATARDFPLRPQPKLDDLAEAIVPAPTPARSRLVNAPLLKRAKPPPAAAAHAHDYGQERRVRRGQMEVEGRIDLHGMTQNAAEAALAEFLHSARRMQKRCVLVITGKGAAERAWPEPQRGVLRRRLPAWLAAHAASGLVAGYASAHRRHGGEGAFYVFLKSNRT